MEETDHVTREGERKLGDIPEASEELFSRAEGDQLCQMLLIEHLMQLSVISVFALAISDFFTRAMTYLAF